MRVSFILIVVLFFIKPAIAQPTYDQSFYPGPEASVTQIVMNSTFAQSFSAGADRVWNYTTSAPIADTNTVNRVPASSAPGSDEFPEADVATVTSNTVMGQQTTNYTFRSVSDSQVAVLGSYTELGEGRGFSLNYTDEKVIRQFPLEFNGSFEDSNRLKGQFSSGPVTIDQQGRGYTQVTYDGYGTIQNSERTFKNVVRLKVIENDTLTQEIGPQTVATKSKSTTYIYKQPGEPGPLIRFSQAKVVSESPQGTNEREATSMTVSPRLWDPTVGLKEPGSLKGIVVMPNPVDGNLQVGVGLKQAAAVELKLFNMQGRLTRRINLGQLKAGNHRETLDVSRLTTGSYQLVLQTPETRKSTTVIVK